MKFALRVMYDLESTRYENGVYVTNSLIVDDYNLTGKSNKKTFQAFAGKGDPQSSVTAERTNATPLRAPNLVLTKEGVADAAGWQETQVGTSQPWYYPTCPTVRSIPCCCRQILLASAPVRTSQGHPHDLHSRTGLTDIYPQPQNPR
jgi:hypothetical protein